MAKGGQAKGDVRGAAADVFDRRVRARASVVLPAPGGGHGVDERLADDERAAAGRAAEGVVGHGPGLQSSIMSGLPNQPGRLKLCSLSMVRIVPLRERMTREFVRAELLP